MDSGKLDKVKRASDDFNVDKNEKGKANVLKQQYSNNFPIFWGGLVLFENNEARKGLAAFGGTVSSEEQ